MSLIHHHEHHVPGLNTASLPDLVFSVLFFFMIVTHMQKVAVKVQYRAPQGTELTRLVKKSAVSYVYIGRPINALTGKQSNRSQVNVPSDYRIQLNDKFASAADVTDYISAERDRMTPEDKEQMTVSIKADRTTPMGIITDVKQALRQAKAYNINYFATERKHQPLP